jgi:hypothetical protein
MGYHIFFEGQIKTNAPVDNNTYAILLEKELVYSEEDGYGWIFKKDYQTLIYHDCEKFGDYEEWILQLMKTLKKAGYTLSGKVKFQGENTGDCGILDICEDTLKITRVDLDKVKFDETVINL